MKKITIILISLAVIILAFPALGAMFQNAQADKIRAETEQIPVRAASDILIMRQKEEERRNRNNESMMWFLLGSQFVIFGGLLLDKKQARKWRKLTDKKFAALFRRIK